MAATLTVRPSHPAMAFSYPTPPATPTSPSTFSPRVTPKPTTISAKRTAIQPPSPNYDLLRSHHASCIKYVIAKLRWEQANNLYLPGESAWREHNTAIQKLEVELKSVQAAQKSLNHFPQFCHAPTAPLEQKPYGPQTKQQHYKAKADAERKEVELDKEIEKQFPFIKQLFIGPMTKQQARNDKLLRKQLKAGDLMDITALLPSENLRMALEQAGEKKVEKRRPYHQVRMEREAEKVKAILAEEAAKKAKEPAEKKEKEVPVGPMTKNEHLASLPVFGPKTREEILLPIQREQRHVVLNFLRKPWPQYDEEAAALLEKFGRLAAKRLNAEVKEKEKP